MCHGHGQTPRRPKWLDHLPSKNELDMANIAERGI